VGSSAGHSRNAGGLRSALRLWGGRVAMVGHAAKLFWKFSFDKPAYTRPQGEIPVDRMTREGLLAAEDRTLWRLGHSSLLMKLQGGFWLTDPVFAERASPLWFAGPRRFHRAPISIKELPAIQCVVISHDHYDHLDKRAIRKLAKKTEWFVVPRGVKAILVGWGVDAGKVREMSWWEETRVGGVKLVATPTQHFSGRTLWNRNQTLFCSWVIEDRSADTELRVFYGADSGYFGGFEEIGERFGPFDVTLLENGAYNVRWRDIHMLPEDTVQAHADLRGRWLLPIHHGTFDLAMHPWTEPMERVQALAAERGVQVCTPRFGEPVRLMAMESKGCWWRGVDATDLQGSGELVGAEGD
jgi:L-ascorbate metabolism protein UlaG (beta-lactamase superfamily)